MQERSLRVLRASAIWLGPVLLLLASLLHGGNEAGSVVESLLPRKDAWLFVHIVQLFAFAMLGFLIVASVPKGDATLFAAMAKVSAFVFAVFYIAADAVAGIGSAVVLDIYAQVPDLDFVAIEGMLYALLESETTRALFLIASCAWLVAAFSLAIARYRAGRGVLENIALALAGLALFWGHGFVFGTAASIALMVFLVLSTRET